jgi:lipopolysaccharide export system protein LptA
MSNRNNKFSLLGASFFGGWLLASSACVLALPDDQRQPIHVTSDTAVQETNVVTYRGNVVIVQGSIKIEADQVVITHEKGKMQRAVATGKPVRFQQQPEAEGSMITGKATTVVYYAADQRVELLQDAYVDRDKSSVRGSRIEYLLPSKTVRAEGSAQNQPGRVDMVFQPQDKPADAQPTPPPGQNTTTPGQNPTPQSAPSPQSSGKP